LIVLLCIYYALREPVAVIVDQLRQDADSPKPRLSDSGLGAGNATGAPGLQQTTGVVQAGGALPPKTITQAAATANAAQSVAVNDQPDRSQSETKAVEKTSTGCLPTKWTGKVDDYKLTKDAVACAVDEHGVVMVTWANWHYYDFVSNWIYHLRAAGVKHFLVGSMDDKLLEALASDGVETFSMASGLTTGDFGWGSATFHKMGREKIGLISTFTQMGFSILVSDVDTVWMKNPLPYMAQYPEADCLTSSDHTVATARDGGLEHYPEAGSAANIGIMLFRPSAADFAKKWLEDIMADDKLWDQNAFNQLMLQGVKFMPKRDDRLFFGWDAKYKFGILPVSRFCSGHTFFVQRMPTKLGLEPYVAHATFQFGGTPGKRNRFREALLWDDPPEYFDGHFVAFTANVPEEMIKAAVPPDNPEYKWTQQESVPQFTLIHHQYRQIRSAWAIAQTFNRTLVLPEIWTGNDRYWGPLMAGRLPGSDVDLPFIAPADHFLDMESMLRDLPESEFGPMLPHGAYRESSFLRNKRLPRSVNESRVTIAICIPGKMDPDVTCADGSAPAVEMKGKVYLNAGLSDKQLGTALQPFLERRILMFDTMLDAFGGFTADDGTVDTRFGASKTGLAFQKRLVQYAGMFCCLNNQHPGHIFYDFFFDVPHTDRFQKVWDNPTWEVTMGP